MSTCPAESLYLAIADAWQRIEERYDAQHDRRAAADAHRAVTETLLQAARARAERRREIGGLGAA